MLAAIEELFASHVAPPDDNGCTLWTGSIDKSGYGLFHDRQKTRRAHRFAWETAHGKIPEDLWVLHRCDVPPCVNVAHLFVGTARDNNTDRDAKGRTRFSQGEAHYNARITAEIVQAIRGRAALGHSQYSIAADYGIARTTVEGIVHRRTWRHL